MIFYIIGGVLLALAAIVGLVLWVRGKRRGEVKLPPLRTEDKSPSVELNPADIEALAEYVKAQRAQAEEEARIRDLKKAEQRAKLETFKQTKDLLKDKLRDQLGEKSWKPLKSILESADKGGVGVYVIYNETRNKYYVGQAKQIHARIRKHFQVEDLARDFLSGDQMHVKFLTANELDNSYRLDHVEKTGIEIFSADKSGYNKTMGNI